MHFFPWKISPSFSNYKPWWSSKTAERIKYIQNTQRENSRVYREEKKENRTFVLTILWDIFLNVEAPIISPLLEGLHI